jgi:hypothetical protein
MKFGRENRAKVRSYPRQVVDAERGAESRAIRVDFDASSLPVVGNTV